MRAKSVETCQGIKRLLLSMASPIGEYNYLQPWVLWRKEANDTLAQIATALG